MIKWPEPHGATYTIASVQYCTITEVLPDTNFYTEAQLKQAVRDALEGAAKACQKLEVAIDGGGNTYYRPADARQCRDAIRALIKEIT